MAKKPTEKQLYKLKNEWLGQFFELNMIDEVKRVLLN